MQFIDLDVVARVAEQRGVSLAEAESMLVALLPSDELEGE